jgi:hypothetical protein
MHQKQACCVLRDSCSLILGRISQTLLGRVSQTLGAVRVQKWSFDFPPHKHHHAGLAPPKPCMHTCRHDDLAPSHACTDLSMWIHDTSSQRLVF